MRLTVSTSEREQLLDITDQVARAVRESGVREGALVLFSLHTTCALTVNEGFDPDVAGDVVAFLRRLVPREAGFRHAEGNSDAHLKVAFLGPSLTLLVERGELVLGRWQRVFLAEWDGPRERRVALRLLPA